MSTERTKHSKEEWDRVNAERSKAEDEAYAQRKAQEGAPSPGPMKLAIRNEFGIYPDEQALIQGRIDQINRHFKEAKDLGRRAKQLAFGIGAELIDLKENKVYQGKWTDFCKAKFPEIHQRVLENCMQLARNREWLEHKYRENESEDSFFEVCPTIKLMLGDIHERNRNERTAQGKPPIRHRSAAKEKRASRPPRDSGETSATANLSDGAESEERVRRPIRDVQCEVVPSHSDETKLTEPESLDSQTAICSGRTEQCHSGVTSPVVAAEVLPPEGLVTIPVNKLCPKCRDVIIAVMLCLKCGDFWQPIRNAEVSTITAPPEPPQNRPELVPPRVLPPGRNAQKIVANNALVR
jgi:hypothetical protein